MLIRIYHQTFESFCNGKIEKYCFVLPVSPYEKKIKMETGNWISLVPLQRWLSYQWNVFSSNVSGSVWLYCTLTDIQRRGKASFPSLLRTSGWRSRYAPVSWVPFSGSLKMQNGALHAFPPPIVASLLLSLYYVRASLSKCNCLPGRLMIYTEIMRKFTVWRKICEPVKMC